MGLILLLVFTSVCTTLAQNICGSVGHKSTVKYQAISVRDNNDQFYLNSDSPSTCSGNITSWRYCYYTPTDPDRSYQIPFAVYRKIDLIYRRISNIFVIDISGARDVNNGFVCGMFSTPTAATIEIGDVIGTCISYEGQSSTLSVVGGINTTDPGKLLMTTENIACKNKKKMSRVRYKTPDTVSPNSLTEIPSTILHLSAEISLPDNQRSSNTTGAVLGSMLSVLFIALLFILVIVCILYAVKHSKVEQSSSSRTLKDSRTSVPTLGDNQNGFHNPNYNDEVAHQYHQLAPSPVDTTPPSPPPAQDQMHYEFAQDSVKIAHSYEYAICGSDDTSIMPYYSYPHAMLESQAMSYKALLQKNQREDLYDGLDPFQEPPTEETEIYNQLKACSINNIPRTDIDSTGHLGSGQFGIVEQGIWKQKNGEKIPVALKTLKEGSSKEDKIKFLQEAAIMAQFRHPNVIALYGVVCNGEPLVLVVQLARKKDLRHYLKSLRPDPGLLPSANLPQLLLNCSQQVALGMQFLAGKGFIHRDLAARNILVSEKTVFKVADFGMSRDLADETYYVAHGGKIPVKWTAPEALHYKKYSTASDVWSYGCLLYEIWSLGRKPFEEVTNENLIRLVQIGYRLPPPPGCPRHIYELMIKCWHPHHSSRPLFREISLTLLVNKDIIFHIPQEAFETHNQAGVLGAPIEAGDKMYEDLQKTYLPVQQN